MKRDEGGFAMISVVLFGVIMLAVTVMTVTQVQQATDQGVGHVSFEHEIALAETGIDQALARLQKNHSWYTTTEVPDVSSAAAEKAWAKTRLIAATPVASDGGEYAIVKPASGNVVYAIGWSPSKANAKRIRMVKAEYLFSTYAPANAVLSNGNLTIGGSANVQGTLGNVHANGNIDVVGNSITVSGTVTATGTIDNPKAGWLGGQPPQEVPQISARSIYEKFALDPSYTENWYDLCPDATVHEPSSSGPCNGDQLSSAGSLFRGWQYKNGSWNNDRSPYDGTYYVYQKSANIKGTSTQWHATVIAEPTGTDGSLSEGDVEMSGNPIMTGYIPDVTLIAGRDLDIEGTGSGDGSYDGLLGAHEQFKITGNPTLTGAVVGEGSADTSGSPVSANYVSGSMIITHNDDLEADLGGLVRTTLWLEL